MKMSARWVMLGCGAAAGDVEARGEECVVAMEDSRSAAMQMFGGRGCGVGLSVGGILWYEM